MKQLRNRRVKSWTRQQKIEGVRAKQNSIKIKLSKLKGYDIHAPVLVWMQEKREIEKSRECKRVQICLVFICQLI